MNNNPENEKIDISEIESVEENADEVFSTVFSAPAEHKRAPKRKKHRLLVAIASVLSVAILIGGTVAVIKLIPEKEEEIKTPFVSEKEISNVLSSDLSKVTLKNQNGTFEFYAEESKDDSTNWYLKGIGKDLVNSSTISYFASEAASFSAIQEISQKSEKDCGMEKPYATVNVNKKDSEEFTITVGSKSPDNSGYYVKYSKDNKIYLVGAAYAENLNVDSLYFATNASLTSFTPPEGAEDYSSSEGQLTNFDSITVKSKKFKDTLVIESNPNEALAQYIGFLVTKPTTRVAENAEGLLSLFSSGVTTSGAYTYDVSAASLKKYGLDKPDFQMTINIKGKTLTYKFTLQKDGNYAAVCDDSKLISMVSPDTISQYAEADIIHFYSAWICLYSIDDIEALNLSVNGKKYNFEIEKLSEEEAENSDVNYAVTLGGKNIDCQSFQNIYQFLISLACTDYTVDKIDSEPQITFEFVFKDKKAGKSVIEFTKAGESRYQYSVDGMELGKTNSSAMNKLIKNLEKLAAGEIIPDIN